MECLIRCSLREIVHPQPVDPQSVDPTTVMYVFIRSHLESRSVARLFVPHMSLIWSNDRKNGFENELFHCEFVLVVGEFTKELLMESTRVRMLNDDDDD